MKGTRKRGLHSGLICILAAVTFLMVFTACSSSKSSDSAANAGSAPAVAEKSASQFDVTEQQLSQNQAAPAEASSSPEAPAAGSDGAVTNTSSGGGIGPIADANAGFGRQVIYKANLVMKVDKFAAAQEQLLNVIHQADAYVLEFSDSRNADERGATYVIKVPSEGFSPFLERLGKIKNLDFQQQVEGTDVTEEFVDLAARLKAKQTVEARLLAFMDKATKTDDLIRFSNELGSVQQEIERIKGRQRYLEQNVDYSTINLRLYESSEPVSILEKEKEKTFGERINDALTGSTKALRQFGEGLVVVLAALLPILVLAIIIAIPTLLVIRKRKSARSEIAKERRKIWNTPSMNLPNNGEDRTAVPEEEPENPDDEPTNRSR